MKKLILSSLSLFVFTLALQAQTDNWKQSQQERSESRTQMQDRSAQPRSGSDYGPMQAVDQGLPDMDLPGMRTVSGQETAPLQQGFTRSTSGSSATNEYQQQNADQPNRMGEQDPESGRWIDRDADGYDPVIDEIEQGAETAVKATGEALETTGNAIDNAFDTVTGGDDKEEPKEQD